MTKRRSQIKHLFNILSDVIISDIKYGLPNVVKWLYRIFITGEITSFSLKNTFKEVTKRASLYQHHSKSITPSPKEKTSVLVLHGDYGHPSSMLQLIDTAQNVNIGSVFSLFLFYDHQNPQAHRLLIKQAIDQINLLTQSEGDQSKSIILIGHSLGAVESAYQFFVEKDNRILSVISIAGRLRIVPAFDNSERRFMNSSIKKIFKAINVQAHSLLYQIIAANDWNTPQEATLVRKKEGFYYIVENAKHLNVIYQEITQIKLTEFLRNSLPEGQSDVF